MSPPTDARTARDRAVVAFGRASATSVVLLVVFVLAFVAAGAWPALTTIDPARWFTDGRWSPTRDAWDITPMVVGSLALTAGALLVTCPLGVAGAVFCRVYAPAPLARLYRHGLGVLAGIPSVVFGFWALVAVVPRIAAVRAPGTSVLAGVVVLSMMTLPTVALVADAALGAVPASVVRGAAALGLGRRAVAWQVLVPAARGGIATGALLQVVRALGETMAVVMVCGNVVAVPASVFDPVRALTANIALEMGYAGDLHRSALFVTGLVLLVVVAGLVVVARRIEARRR